MRWRPSTAHAQQWEDHIADPITVNIDADFDDLPAGILGSTSSVVLAASYNFIRDQMVTDAADEVDDTVAGFLPTAAQFTGFLPIGFTFGSDVQATKANLKAMGFGGLDNDFGMSDGNIEFNTDFSSDFDFDKSDGVTAGMLDFESIAAHEIGHVLGFISDVDYIDFKMSQAMTATDVAPTTLDLFCFDNAAANDPTTLAEFTTKPRDMVPGSVDHFDQIAPLGGDTEILFSTGLSQGNGRQATHWKDGLGLGLMDPTLSDDEISLITANDLRALDLMGYEITAIPEARAWLCCTLVTSAGWLSSAIWRR